LILQRENSILNAKNDEKEMKVQIDFDPSTDPYMDYKDFINYLLTKQLFIEIYEAEKLFFIGFVKVPLKDLLRQGKASIYQTKEFEIFDDKFNEPLGDSLNILSENLENINFGNSFDQPLDDSLSNLANLNSITFGNSFDQPLGDSFKKLFELQNKNYKPLQPYKFYDKQDEKEYYEEAEEHYEKSFLREIKFGNSFNQPIIDSLRRSHLTSIIVGTSFNQPIDDYGYYKDIIRKIP
jgi:hypothetical protein